MEGKKSQDWKSKLLPAAYKEQMYYDQYMKQLAQSKERLWKKGITNSNKALACLRVSSLSESKKLHSSYIQNNTCKKRNTPTKRETNFENKFSGITGKQMIPSYHGKAKVPNADTSFEGINMHKTVLGNIDRLKAPVSCSGRFEVARDKMLNSRKHEQYFQTTVSDLLHLVMKSSASIPTRNRTPKNPGLALQIVSKRKSENTLKLRRDCYFKTDSKDVSDSAIQSRSCKELRISSMAKLQRENNLVSKQVLPSVNAWSKDEEGLSSCRDLLTSHSTENKTNSAVEPNILQLEYLHTRYYCLPKDSSSYETKAETKPLKMESVSSSSVQQLSRASTVDETSAETTQSLQKFDSSKESLQSSVQPNSQTNCSIRAKQTKSNSGISIDSKKSMSGKSQDSQKSVLDVNPDCDKLMPTVSPECNKSVSDMSGNIKESGPYLRPESVKLLFDVSSNSRNSGSEVSSKFKKSVSEVSLQTESFPSASSSDKNQLNEDKLSQSSNISVDRADNSLPDIEQTTSRKSDSYASESRLTTPEQYYEEDMIKLPDIHSSNQLTNQRFQDF